MRLGIDIGGTKTAVVVLADTRDGGVAGAGVGDEVTPVATASAPSGRGGREVVEVAARLAREAAAAVGGLGAISSVGACTPGLVDPATGWVRHAVNLEVEALDLAGGLEQSLRRPVRVDNDVKAAALGAHRLSGRTDVRTLAYLNLGTGLASAVVVDGVVVRGVAGVAGEIGHLPVGGDVSCPCGQVGCLETLASGSAIARLWPVEGRLDRDPFVAAARGDDLARSAVESLCRGVGLAVEMLAIASGAEHVVIGGGLVALGAPLRAGIRADLERRGASSSLVAGLGLPDRFELLPASVPVAALGAAWLHPSGPTAGEVG
ncbi:MAG: ROK family protein [Terracoccus sp.]